MTPSRALVCLALLLAALLSACGPAITPTPAHPLVIAHRGASGERAQHSLAAYRLAHAQGADAIEPDLVATRDGVLVCSHDVWVEAGASGVEAFADRVGEDGRLYLVDLTLDELATLRRNDPRHDGPDGFGYVTFDAFLALVDELDRAAGRRTLVVPELKHPGFHRDRGAPLEQALLQILARYGYRERDDRAIVQCFDAGALRLLRDLGCALRLVLLLGEPIEQRQLDVWNEHIDGIGPARLLIEPKDGKAPAFDLVAAAHARSLVVYAYTFGDEPGAMARFFDDHGVDGLFTDFPAVGVAVRQGRR